MTSEFKNIPKGDLHIHLTGSISPKEIRVLAKKVGVDLSKFEPLETKMNYFRKDIWEIVKLITLKPQGYALAIELILAKSAKDGIKKLEIISNLRGITRRGLNLDKTINLVAKVFEKYKKRGIDGSIRIGTNREEKSEGIVWAKNVYHQYKKRPIFCGIDINGNERHMPTNVIEDDLISVVKEGVPLTIHAGEYPDMLDSLESAVKIGPNRIGHGLALINNKALIEQVIKKKIILEICPTSNPKLNVINEISKHPIIQLSKVGVPFVVGTDNPGIFGTCLSQEYALLNRAGIKKELLTKAAKRSLEIS